VIYTNGPGRTLPRIPGDRSVGCDLLARSDRVEARVRLSELERHLTDRTVAMLRDLCLEQLHLGFGILLALAIQEDDDVSILLDAA
jgi:hypothetical protein